MAYNVQKKYENMRAKTEQQMVDMCCESVQQAKKLYNRKNCTGKKNYTEKIVIVVQFFWMRSTYQVNNMSPMRALYYYYYTTTTTTFFLLVQNYY